MKEPKSEAANHTAPPRWLQRMVRRPPLTPEQHHRAVLRYSRQAAPFIEAIADLEGMMPLTLRQESDGTVTKLEEYNWPQWAIEQKAMLLSILDSIRRKAFEDA